MASKKVTIFLHYHQEEKKYEMDSSIPLKQHMTRIAELFGISNPTIYGLKKSSTSHFLSESEVSNPNALSAYDCCLLTLEPQPYAAKYEKQPLARQVSVEGNSPASEDNEKAPIQQLGRVLDDLKSKNPAKEKKVCFDLKNYCTDLAFCEAFAKMRGVELLSDVIGRSRGNQLAYGLLALITYCHNGKSFDWVNIPLMKQFESFCKDSANPLNVRKSALQLLNFFTSHTSPVLQIRTQWLAIAINEFPFQEIFHTASRSDVTDVTLIEATLSLVQNFLESLPQKEWEKFIIEKKIDHFILSTLNTIHTNEKIYQTIAAYQQTKLKYINLESSIPFDENNTEHEQLLKRLWHGLNPNQNYPGPTGEHWKEIGFQGKNPVTDLRAMGIMGLKHLVYFAEHKPDQYRKQVQKQNSKEIEKQYPVSAVGINVSRLLGQVLCAESKLVFPFLFEPHGYEECYCTIFGALDARWERLEATYMQFGSVNMQMKQIIESVLQQPQEKIPKNLVEFWQAIDLEERLTPCTLVVQGPTKKSGKTKNAPKTGISSSGFMSNQGAGGSSLIGNPAQTTTSPESLRSNNTIQANAGPISASDSGAGEGEGAGAGAGAGDDEDLSPRPVSPTSVPKQHAYANVGDLLEQFRATYNTGDPANTLPHAVNAPASPTTTGPSSIPTHLPVPKTSEILGSAASPPQSPPRTFPQLSAHTSAANSNTNSNSNSNSNKETCDRCDEAAAVYCEGCAVYYCNSCRQNTHTKGRWATHVYTSAVTATTTANTKPSLPQSQSTATVGVKKPTLPAKPQIYQSTSAQAKSTPEIPVSSPWDKASVTQSMDRQGSPSAWTGTKVTSRQPAASRGFRMGTERTIRNMKDNSFDSLDSHRGKGADVAWKPYSFTTNTDPEPNKADSHTGADPGPNKAHSHTSPNSAPMGRSQPPPMQEVSPSPSPSPSPPQPPTKPQGMKKKDTLFFAKQGRLRQNVIEELISTEQTYVDDLKIIIEVFIIPLRLRNAVNHEDLGTVFSNIETLYNCNSTLLNTLLEKKIEIPTKKSEDEAMNIGDVFLQIVPFLKMYNIYTANRPKSESKLEELKKNVKFQEVLKICQRDPRCKGLPLNSFLVKPIQRICKYPLLFRELVAQFDEDKNNTEKQKLLQVLEKIDECAHYINERTKEREQSDRIIEIQNLFINEKLELVNERRKVIKEGQLSARLNGGQIDKATVFLFNDIVLIAREASVLGLFKKEGLELRARLTLTQTRITQISNSNSTELESQGAKWEIIAPDEEENLEWLRQFRAAKKELVRKEFDLQKRTEIALRGSVNVFE